MNIAKCSILFFTIFFTTLSFAAASLSTLCQQYGGTMLTDVTVESHSYNTIQSSFNIRTSNAGNAWYGVKASNNGSLLSDIAKTAIITKENVDVCYNYRDTFLLGIEWTKNSNEEAF